MIGPIRSELDRQFRADRDSGLRGFIDIQRFTISKSI